MINSPLLPTFILFGLGAIQFAVTGFVVWQRRLTEWPVRLFVAYGVVAGLWDWVRGLGLWVAPLQAGGLLWVDAYSLILLGAIFFWMTRTFLRTEGRGWTWGLVAVLALGLVSLLLLYPLPGSWPVGAPTLGLLVASLAWAIYLGGSGNYTLQAYRQRNQPLHRNRITYWFFALGLVLVSGVFFIISRETVAALVQLAATSGLAYITINHRLPDVRQNSRKAMAYIVVGFVAALIYVLVIAAAEYGLMSAKATTPGLRKGSRSYLWPYWYFHWSSCCNTF